MSLIIRDNFFSQKGLIIRDGGSILFLGYGALEQKMKKYSWKYDPDKLLHFVYAVHLSKQWPAIL
jgi:hypothetical protein